MNHLIVYAHPNPGSFCRGVLDAVRGVSSQRGWTTTVRDLYAMKFSPVLSSDDIAAIHSGRMPADIAAEQDLIRKADLTTFIYPVWWQNMPAILKGYIDRVMAFGFAYSFDAGGVKPLLVGKKAIIINTYGAARSDYEGSGLTSAMKLTVDGGTFGFCGVDVIEHFHFHGVTAVDESARKKMLSEATSYFNSLKI